jgi:luciferase family oxidoreductase group 1
VSAPTTPALSVLDLVPVRGDQSTGDALAATRRLARVADELGYRRYWLAEHHNMPAVAATNPPVLVAMIAAATERIRVGSGGVMLPNHAPLVVAEQFALLEAAHPGRIDLGLGRAPGTDPVTAWALRHGAGGVEADAAERFPEYVENIAAMLSPAGAALRLATGTHALRATPHATSVPTVWLLGSSDFSARLAAERGLPYVFAHHFSGRGTAESLALYRDGYRPSAEHPRPRTFLTVNVVVAPTQEEAERLVLPNLLSMLALRTGQPLHAQRLVEEVERERPDLVRHEPARQMLERWVVGTPESAAEQVRSLAGTFAVDEVMVHPVAGAVEGTDPRRSPAREETLRLLAAGLARGRPGEPAGRAVGLQPAARSESADEIG